MSRVRSLNLSLNIIASMKLVSIRLHDELLEKGQPWQDRSLRLVGMLQSSSVSLSRKRCAAPRTPKRTRDSRDIKSWTLNRSESVFKQVAT